MTILERMKLELNNKNYYTDAEYTQFLIEAGADMDIPYDYVNSHTNRRSVLRAVKAVFESLANNIDYFRTITTEFATTTQAMGYINDRINSYNKQIAELDALDTASGTTSNITFMYRNWGAYGHFSKCISRINQ